MKDKIYITGSGIISAIGIGKEETLASLIAQKSGIEKINYLGTKHKNIPVGEVKLTNEEMTKMLRINSSPTLTRSSLMGIIALREALAEANLSDADLSNVHFISATTVGGMDRREIYHDEEANCNKSGALIATHSCCTSTEMIAKAVGRFASLSTVSTACSSATNAIIAGANMLRCGLADIVVVGGTECLSKFHLNGFNTLMILDKEKCRPFDAERAGLNLGEGAAYIVLETESSVQKRKIRPRCEVSGYGNACDAYHQTASSPDGIGAVISMRKSLDMANLLPVDIDYINAHGTGTPNNDESETQAIKTVFGGNIPPFSSTKSFTGHTTSASGSIEIVICMLAMDYQFFPVNLNWRTKMEGGLIPVTNVETTKEIKHILSNAFGFGGNDSTIILSKL